MPELKQVLETVGVWSWLHEQFPDLTDDELLAAIRDDFGGLVEDLLEKWNGPTSGITGKAVHGDSFMIEGNISSAMQKCKGLTLFDPSVFQIFVKTGEIVEVRIPKARGKSPAWGGEWARGTVSGYFDDHAAFCDAVKEADKGAHDGIYFTLQPIDPRLLARSFNRLKPTDLSTSDKDVTAYRWLPVDLDPVRPSGIPSSDAELQAAMTLRAEIAGWVVEELGFPTPITAMSGNGAHLLFPLPDLPPSKIDFVKNTLLGLAQRFNTPDVAVDTSVFNPARIWKLYGTTARKGDPVPVGPKREARPHRMAYIDDMGDAA
jgi:hypothetical protein